MAHLIGRHSIVKPPPLIVPDKRIIRAPAIRRLRMEDGPPPLIARCKGREIWRGKFRSSLDCLRFIHAVMEGSLRSCPELWRLPTPAWSPDFWWPDVYYGFLAVDGHNATAVGTASSGTVSLTTTNAGDLVLVGAWLFAGSTTVSSVSGGGLTWAKRSGIVTGSDDLELWWAVASAVFNATITVNFGASCPANALVAWGVSGADLGTPFDTNGSVPSTNAGGSNTAPTTNTGVTTNAAQTMIIGLEGQNTSTTQGAGGSFAIIAQATTTNTTGAAESLVVNSVQSNLTVSFSAGGGTAWAIIADAIRAAPNLLPDAFKATDIVAPAARYKRYAAIARGDDGNEAPFVFVPPTVFAEGWQIQPPQPPARTQVVNRAAGGMKGDEGTQAPMIVPFAEGWAVPPPQPPARAANVPSMRAGGTMRGDDGVFGGVIGFFPMGWEVAPHQPQHPRPERAGAIMPIEQGNESIFVFVPSAPPVGWMIPPPQPPARPRNRFAGALMRGVDGIEAPFFAILDRFDWGPESFTIPQRPRWNRAGAMMKGLDGIEQPFFAARAGFDLMPQTLLRKRKFTIEAADGGIEAPFQSPSWGWETVQTSLLRRREFTFDPALALTLSLPPLVDAADWVPDFTEYLRPQRRVAAIENEPALPVFFRPSWGFERPNDNLRRPNRASIPISTPDLDIEVPARLNWVQGPDGFVRPRPRRTVLDRGYELVSSFPPVLSTGWSVVLPDFPRRRQIQAGAIMPKEDGFEYPFIVPVFRGWDPSLVFPPHRKFPERAGAIMQGDISGAWGIFRYTVPSGAIASDSAVWIAVPYDIGLPP